MKKITVRRILTIASLLLSVSGPAVATQNSAAQNELNQTNRRTEFMIAKDDCATQLGITLPPPPHTAQKLDPNSREQMRACLSQKGFLRRTTQAATQQRTVSGQ